MKIERVDIIHVQIPLLLPYETSYNPNFNVDKIVLKVYTPDAVVFSECVCKDTPGSTYETPGTVRVMLKEFFLPAVMGREIRGPEDVLDFLRPFKGHNMAKAGLENAVWTLAALKNGVSVSRLLGGTKDRVPVGHGVGIQQSIEEALDVINRYVGRGYPRIKMKIKHGWDLKVLERVRKDYPDLPLMVDANTDYTYPQDVEHLKTLDRFNLIMVEQPFTWEDLHFHAKLQAEMRTSICLDESILSPYTARLAGELRACRIINIKQGRVGGLARSKAIHDIARDAGIGCWVGQMIETGLAQTYGLAVAALDNCIYHNDLIPTTDYVVEDIIEPPITLNSDGTVDVPQGPGLGVDINEKTLDKYTVSREVVRIRPVGDRGTSLRL
jgi:O-succinylbenzoate synthase